MTDISAFGLKIRMVFSKTFPAGFDVTDFADDGDPIDCPSVQVADKAMGPNGHLITWSKANPLLATLNVIPGGSADKNLAIAFQANRPGKGKQPARDVVTMVKIWPNGQKETFSVGAITDGMPGQSASSAGRMKTKPYAFAFENYV